MGHTAGRGGGGRGGGTGGKGPGNGSAAARVLTHSSGRRGLHPRPLGMQRRPAPKVTQKTHDAKIALGHQTSAAEATLFSLIFQTEESRVLLAMRKSGLSLIN